MIDKEMIKATIAAYRAATISTGQALTRLVAAGLSGRDAMQMVNAIDFEEAARL